MADKPPTVVRLYMKEFSETASQVRHWLHRQKAAYENLADPGDTDLVTWIAHKMTVSEDGARQALTWAGIEHE